MKKSIFAVTLLISLLFIVRVSSLEVNAAESKINIVINGNPVIFTELTGFPYLDENNRTLVPLRVTMETAGAAIGYDSEKRVAIIIPAQGNGRIEVPIDNKIIYKNNEEIINDTNAVIYNGKTYLPIRAVLEAAGFNVEWDGKTSIVNAYTFKFDENEFVPYSAGSLETLLEEILKGHVVYINGQYYATPEHIRMQMNTQIYYLNDDLNTAIYPQKNNRYDLREFDSSVFESDEEYDLDGIVIPND